MEQNKKILVTIDGAENSIKLVRYVAGMIQGWSDVEVYLLHLITPIPPVLREHGGSEDPNKEEQLGKQLRAAQAQWIEEKRKEASPLLERAKSIILESGVSPQSMKIESRACMEEATIDQCILDTAHDWDTGTIVVGWDSFPWFEELFKSHIAEKLIKKGRGRTFWVVEGP